MHNSLFIYFSVSWKINVTCLTTNISKLLIRWRMIIAKICKTVYLHFDPKKLEILVLVQVFEYWVWVFVLRIVSDKLRIANQTKYGVLVLAREASAPERYSDTEIAPCCTNCVLLGSLLVAGNSALLLLFSPSYMKVTS